MDFVLAAERVKRWRFSDTLLLNMPNKSLIFSYQIKAYAAIGCSDKFRRQESQDQKFALRETFPKPFILQPTDRTPSASGGV